MLESNALVFFLIDGYGLEDHLKEGGPFLHAGK